MAKSKASRTAGSVALGRRERSRSQNSEVICGRDRVDEPEAWRIRERVFRKWVRRNGLVWVDVPPLRKEKRCQLLMSMFEERKRAY